MCLCGHEVGLFGAQVFGNRIQGLDGVGVAPLRTEQLSGRHRKVGAVNCQSFTKYGCLILGSGVVVQQPGQRDARVEVRWPQRQMMLQQFDGVAGPAASGQLTGPGQIGAFVGE